MQQDAAWQRWVPLTGILFVILFIIGFGIMDLPGLDDSDADVTAFYSDSDNRVRIIIGAYILAIAGVALLIFVNRLRRVIQDAEGDRPRLATGAFGAGIVFVVAFLVAVSATVAVPFAVEFDEYTQVPNADLARFLPAIGYVLIFVTGMFAAILMIATTALASFRYALFPTWFNWLSVVCAIVLLFAALFFPILALFIWFVAASFVLMRRQPTAA